MDTRTQKQLNWHQPHFSSKECRGLYGHVSHEVEGNIISTSSRVGVKDDANT
jgi:hypothetical protein